MRHAHRWQFIDRCQLSLVDTSLGGYAVAMTFGCQDCLAVTELLGVCSMARWETHLHSERHLMPNGLWSAPRMIDSVIPIPCA